MGIGAGFIGGRGIMNSVHFLGWFRFGDLRIIDKHTADGHNPA